MGINLSVMVRSGLPGSRLNSDRFETLASTNKGDSSKRETRSRVPLVPTPSFVSRFCGAVVRSSLFLRDYVARISLVYACLCFQAGSIADPFYEGCARVGDEARVGSAMNASSIELFVAIPTREAYKVPVLWLYRTNTINRQ